MLQVKSDRGRNLEIRFDVILRDFMIRLCMQFRETNGVCAMCSFLCVIFQLGSTHLVLHKNFDFSLVGQRWNGHGTDDSVFHLR